MPALWIAVLVTLLVLAIAVGIAVLVLLWKLSQQMHRDQENLQEDDHGNPKVTYFIRQHFEPATLPEIAIGQRSFPMRMRVDLQRIINRLFDAKAEVSYFSGLRMESAHEVPTLADCLASKSYSAPMFAPPEYEDVDIGEEQPVPCLKSGIWFWEEEGEKLVALLSICPSHYGPGDIRFQMASLNTPAGSQLTRRYLQQVEDVVQQASCYRGKILSLEKSDDYRGLSSGITVHKLHTVSREQVILPPATVELLDRNVIQFCRQRPDLARLGQATKKGILFYGPPGTGKTHTIHYLAKALPGHTMFLITAEQVAWLAEYMTLARLMQPSIVVLEDVDLIARERSAMGSACEESLLNKLLNEMDGLKQAADILFLLTTNRPQALEAALASRPGRVDQAIEFPLPDDEGRRKLVRLYAGQIEIAADLVEYIVTRTDKVSASFIKELVRRAAQFHLENNGTNQLKTADVDQALEEMLFSGGSLNLKLLGAEARQVGFVTA